MKYLESYKLFERVTVPGIETSTDKSDSIRCGNCLATKGGKPLISPPKQTFRSLDNYQNQTRSRNEDQKEETKTTDQTTKEPSDDLESGIKPRGYYEGENKKQEETKPTENPPKILFENNPGLKERINSVFKSAKNWYTDHYMKEETLQKFKKKENRNKLVDFINNEIKLLYWNRESVDKNSEISSLEYSIYKDWEKEYSNFIGWVWSNRCDRINLNMENYKEDPDYKQSIPHELGHCIYLKLKELGEDPISGNKDASRSDSPNFKATGVNPSLSDEESTKIEDTETHLTSEPENQTRIMLLRRLLNIGPRDTCQQIKQKFEENIRNDKLKFRYLILSEFVKKQNEDCYWLKLKVLDKYKGWITDPKFYIGGKPRLALIYDLLKCSFNGEDNLDFPRLFSVFSEYGSGFIWLNLSKLTQLNIDVVRNDSPQTGQERRA